MDSSAVTMNSSGKALAAAGTALAAAGTALAAFTAFAENRALKQRLEEAEFRIISLSDQLANTEGALKNYQALLKESRQETNALRKERQVLT